MSIFDEAINEITDFGYEVVKHLGKGAFGTVYLGKKDGQEFAIKTVKKELIQSDEKLIQLFESEKQLLGTIKSNHIIQLKEFKESPTNYFLIMEYCNGGNLRQYIGKQKFISEKEARGYLLQLLNGFKDLHEHMVIHRDIKLDNIMRHFPNGETGNELEDSQNVVLKIVDLGLAKDMKEQLITYTQAGSPLTMAPEILRQRPYGFEVDVYSLGVILYQMVQGYYPFFDNNSSNLLKKIKAQRIEFSRPIGEPFKDLITQMLKYNRKQRIQWCDILYHDALLPQNQLTKSYRYNQEQNEELCNSRVGFEKINVMYEISLNYPEYQFKQKLVSIPENQFISTYVAVNILNKGEQVVVQQVQVSYYEKADFEQTSNQILENFNTIKQIQAKSLIKIHQSSKSKDKFYIVSDYLSLGNLYSEQKQNKIFTPSDILTILNCVLQALKWLHENQMIHRNICPQSIYLGDLQLFSSKITSYKLGGYKYCYSLKGKSQHILTKYNGMSFYTAPEILENKLYSRDSDIYSLGIVLYELIYGTVPYKGDTKQELLDNIYQQKRQQRRTEVKYDQKLLDLIDQMIKPNQRERITFEKIWNESLLKQNHVIFDADTLIHMQNFYDASTPSGQFQLAEFMDEKCFTSLLEQSQQFSLDSPFVPRAKVLTNNVQKFNFSKYPRLYVSEIANIPTELNLSQRNSIYYSEVQNKQQNNIFEFQNKQKTNENNNFTKFQGIMHDLIDKYKKKQEFELCKYYKAVLDDITQKKQDYEQTQDPFKKYELKQYLHINYNKVFQKS